MKKTVIIEGKIMRILVISDSHNRVATVEKIIRSQPNARVVFFLGDNASDMDEMPMKFPDKIFNVVKGNCDFGSMRPTTGVDIVADKKIFFTHGHTLGVKYGVANLVKTAKINGADIALYGHTHISQILYEDGVYVVNPGSCSEPRDGTATYAVIDIMESGILPAIIKV